MLQSTRNLSSRLIAAIAVCASLAVAVAADAQNNKFVLNDSQFNSWLYQGSGQPPDPDSEATLTIEAIDRTCHLNAEQKEKLLLAAQGDFARFNQQVDDLRSEMVGKSYDQKEFQELYQKIQPLTQRYQAGMLGSTSLFAKVVHQVLEPEQQEEYEAAEAARRKIRHGAKVRLFVALLEQSCPLKSSQRDAFVSLLLKDTQPPLRASEYDWYVVIVQVAKIPDTKLKPILDQAQLTFLKKILAQGRGMEGHLQRIGVLPTR